MKFVSRLAGVAVCACLASNIAFGVVNNITQATVHATIQNAIDNAVNGDIIEADPGTYVENIDFNGLAITLRSASGNPADTIIDGNGAGSVVTCNTGEGPDTVLSGFTITNGSAADLGGGIAAPGSSPTVSNCFIVGNTAGVRGGGMHTEFSAPHVTNCVFSGNTAPLGGGLYMDTASPIVSNCAFSLNGANPSEGAIRIVYGAPAFVNTIVWGNAADQAFKNELGTPSFAHCDLEGGLPVGATDLGGNIDADPRFVDADGFDDIAGTLDDNLRLRPFSPCIDAARDALLPTVADAGLSYQFDLFLGLGSLSGAALPIDLDGMPRAFDSPYSLATPEEYSSTPGVAIPDNDPLGVSATEVVSFGPATIDRVELDIDITHTYVRDLIITLESPMGTVVTVWDRSCNNQNNMDATFGDGLAFASCPEPFAPTAFSAEAMGAFAGEPSDGTWTVTVSDNQSADTGTFNAFSIVFTSSAVDMGPYENTSVPPTSIQVPTDVATIQGAIDLIVDDSSSAIGVEPGTYYENLQLRGKAFTLMSVSGDPTDTIIDGSSTGRVISAISGETPDTVISGFTIANGAGPSGAGMNMIDVSPTVTNCIFLNNVGTNGALFIDNASPAITNCRFLGNSATSSGGAIFIRSLGEPIITNCVFSGNTADGDGGAIATDAGSSFRLTNCTFSMNTAGGSGGAISSLAASATLANCILWGDAPAEVFVGLGIDFTHCDIQGGEPIRAGGNFNADPLFVDADGPDDMPGTLDDNLRLQTGSPCIDAGRDALLPTIDEAGLVPTLGATFADAAIPHDLDGNARVFDSPHVPATPQVFSATPGLAIPDSDLSGVTADLLIAGAPMMIDRVELEIDATHTYIGDLIFTLESPMGTTVTVWNRSCSSFDDIMDATFGDGFDFGLCDSPFTGPATSREAMGAFDGEDADGTWILTAIDVAFSDIGTLDAFSIVLKPSAVDMGAYENQSPCRGDIDGDGDTDVFDFGIFAANFMTNVAPGTNGDFDKSGLVDIFDFSIFAPDFQCPFNP